MTINFDLILDTNSYDFTEKLYICMHHIAAFEVSSCCSGPFYSFAGSFVPSQVAIYFAVSEVSTYNFLTPLWHCLLVSRVTASVCVVTQGNG